MKRLKKRVSNENGLTLIELIASITILSIVILTFLVFFTNAFKFNSINSNNIQAMNIAREQQSLVNDPASNIDVLLQENIADSIQAWEESTHEPMKTKRVEETNDQFILEIENAKYEVYIYINKVPESLDSTYNKLHQVHVTVMENGKLVSETYTYYELKIGELDEE